MEQQADIDNRPLISYKKVSINQQALCVLTDIDFELNKGDFVYLIGKVGSGKSTFLKPSMPNSTSTTAKLTC